MAVTNAEETRRAEISKLALSNGVPLELPRSRDFYRFLILVLLFGICTLFYYFGELVDFTGWTALRWSLFYDPHDIQRLCFLAPIIYACYFFGVKAMMTVTALSLIAFLPRAIMISTFHDAILRAVLFTIVSGVACSLIRIGRNKVQQRTSVEAVARNVKNNFVGIQKKIEDGVFIVGELEVDLYKRLVKRHGQNVKLTPTEYKLLAYLVSNAEKAVSQKELLRHVWGPEYAQESEYVRNFIRQLRRKIEDDPSNPRFIVTETRFGYRFVCP